MRKVLLLAVSILIYNFANSQTMFVGGQIDGDWGNQYPMNTVSLGSGDYFYFTIQATSDYTDAKFLFQADNYYNKWDDVTSDVNIVKTYTWHDNSGGEDNVIDSDVSNGKYYTFRLENNGYSSSKGIVMETTNEPRTITNVSYTSNSLFSDGDPVTVTIIINGTKSTEENFYVRYTTDGWTNSNLATISFVETTGTATIPTQNAETTVQFYVFSTTLINPSDDFDLISLNYNNNNGSNFEYTVNYGTSQTGNWSDNSTWNSGSVPASGKSIAINHNVTLNQDATVSSLFINTGVTFTASDGSKANRRLTVSGGGKLSNLGTFNSADGTVAFAGIDTISGIISFYNVEINDATDFGTSSTITNNLTVKSGYATNNAPVYAENSNLIFETGSEYWITTDMILWAQGNALDKGVPHNVIVSNSTPFHIYASRNTIGDFSVHSGVTVDQGNISFDIGGDFTNNGDFYIVTDGTNPLIVDGNFTNNDSIALSNTNGGDLKVAGNFTDNGTFTHNDRAVFFNGSSQRISGTSETSLGYVLVENDAHVTLAYDKDLNIDHDFTIGDGSKAAGSFIIESTSSGTGSLITGGAVPTTIEVERYIEGWSTDVGKDGWHLLSIPFTSFTVDPSDFKPGNNDDLYYYKEPIDMWINWKTGGTPNSDPGFNFAAGKGYLCSYETGGVKSFSGTLNNTAVVANNLTKDGNGNRTEAGWNMIGNPYPSSILWNNSWGSNINAIAKVYPGTGNYIDVDPVKGIPSTQAFFVQVTATTSLTIPLSARLHSDEAWLKSPYDDTKTLTFKVSGGGNFYLDQTRIRFNEEATEEFDHQYDSFKLFGFPNAPQLYTEVQNEPYSTNTYPRIELDRVIDLEFIPGTSGEHQIELIENTCNEDCFVLLDDLFNHVTVDITANKTYKFDANTGDDSHRFKIRFSAVGIDEEIQKESLQAYMSGDQLHILGEEGRAFLYVFNIQGQQLLQEQVMLNNQYSRTLNLKSGIYLVSLRSQNETKTTKISIR